MPIPTSKLQTKILRQKTSPEEYRLYLAALEWDLTEPIIIESRKDIKSEYRWREKGLEPFHHQITNLITFCRRLPVTLIADDVGLGKTISAGLVMSELIARSRLSKILIVCPKLLCPQWKDELESKFGISSEVVVGKELSDADPDEIGAIITTYNSARLYLDSMQKDRYQMLVLDEAHKLRNLYGVEKTPEVAKRFKVALIERRFKYVLMLTATPIQNRLWDLYSLVDLLTVARGHQNPFGSEQLFARKFIADSINQARQLKQSAQEEFRSIVYGYMSRIRRGDAKLYFPDRVVQMHKVDPTPAELQLNNAIAEPIQKLNRLSQISILQALTSSPEALMAQLANMAKKGTVPTSLASTVRDIVTKMPISAKLRGLGALIDKLKSENPKSWRVVIFTGRLETQTTILLYLEKQGFKVGVINGQSGQKNQDTIAGFKKDPPKWHIIVSTEAGSEGVNLQVANVLVNYDLPWNPMIVEQRIGRVQRLGSIHASIGVFNITLRGTFEEYIVGRLMEKLLMASHAIGDIESLLEASGVSDDDENGGVGFDEKIRQLVIAALAGKDIEASKRQAEKSIEDAKKELEREKENINSLLGGMDGAEYIGPRTPSLPSPSRSIDHREFTLAALVNNGARVTPQKSGLHLVEESGRREYIHFEENTDLNVKSSLYAPGSSSFQQLVSKVIATGICDIEEKDNKPVKESEELARKWVQSFGGTIKSTSIDEIRRCFEGNAVVRVRATVAHDSYERLVQIKCSPDEHFSQNGQAESKVLQRLIDDPRKLGIDLNKLADSAKLDAGISEFCRFYLERRDQEMNSAGDDERKRKKLEDEFTPRLDMILVGLDGNIFRQIKVNVYFRIDSKIDYNISITVKPYTEELIDIPEMGVCNYSKIKAPKTCLKRCEISNKIVLQHYLIQSEISSRFALPEHTLLCGLSGKRVLKDEAEVSSISGLTVASSLLKTSILSGKRAEPSYFSKCEFTKVEVLKSEIAISEVSGKGYRIDEQLSSDISGKTGHKSEFITCFETKQNILKKEAEKCNVTGNYVRKGILETCEITQKRVLSSELERCASTGKKALRNLLVTSSISNARILDGVALRSIAGKYCSPSESKESVWVEGKYHPDDIRTCRLTGLTIYYEYSINNSDLRLQPLVELLDGIKRPSDKSDLWNSLVVKLNESLKKGKQKIESAQLSPDGQHLAVCSEVQTMFGLRTRHAGFVYSLKDQSIIGRVVLGKRTTDGWAIDKD